MLEFSQDNSSSEPIFNPQVIPKELEIYYRDEASFLPPGKTYADLTEEEMKILQSQYRFSPFRPGLNQTITGFRNSI